MRNVVMYLDPGSLSLFFAAVVSSVATAWIFFRKWVTSLVSFLSRILRLKSRD